MYFRLYGQASGPAPEDNRTKTLLLRYYCISLTFDVDLLTKQIYLCFE
jgi:hypothetical protein